MLESRAGEPNNFKTGLNKLEIFYATRWIQNTRLIGKNLQAIIRQLNPRLLFILNIRPNRTRAMQNINR